jgi:hypothetical protein
MRYFLTISSVFFFAACTQQNGSFNKISKSIDSLTQEVRQLQRVKYKPGLGEIMASIQMHHAKLWYAGINTNWKLSVFEMDEIKELLATAIEMDTDRPEIKDLPMIYPSLDSLSLSIQAKNLVAFKKNFLLLTRTCNSCHLTNHFAFNIITIPTAAPVSNQDFKPH